MHRINDVLPIGYSDIKEVIKTGYYVDKTRYAQALIEKQNPVFIARPRRFGKSLFINTLATICEGEKYIFNDFHIGNPENRYEWKKYPVIRLDFSGLSSSTPEELGASIKRALKEIAFLYKIEIEASTVKDTLRDLVRQLIDLKHASKKEEIRESDYEPRVVVLIDEYDAPVVNLTKGSDLEQTNIKVMKDFFMTLKSLNSYFKLTFITGVSKFSLSDVFSGANHLHDITLDRSADAMFGYTEAEVLTTFSTKIHEIAFQWSKTANKPIGNQEVVNRMAAYYNGYIFHKNGISVYNPWSTLKFLENGECRNYWYESGNPTILIDQMLTDPDRFKFNELPVKATEYDLMYTGSRNEINLTSLMFQTGYLTIEGYDEATEEYTLKFPNKEIEKSFQKSLQDSVERNIKNYFSTAQQQMQVDLTNKNIDAFIDSINAAFYAIPYYLDTKREGQYHSNLHMLLQGLGFVGRLYCEQPASTGRPDIILELPKVIYIMEIKYKSSGSAALQQIKDNRYYQPYLSRKKEIALLGINFSEKIRAIDNWEYEVYNAHLEK